MPHEEKRRAARKDRGSCVIFLGNAKQGAALARLRLEKMEVAFIDKVWEGRKSLSKGGKKGCRSCWGKKGGGGKNQKSKKGKKG